MKPAVESGSDNSKPHGGGRCRWRSAMMIGAMGLTTGVMAAPAGIELAPPTIALPATYLLENHVLHSTLAVEISTFITRAQFCAAPGNIFGPCPPQETPVRFTVGLGTGGRPFLTVQKTVSYEVAGVANFGVMETVRLDPESILSDEEEYTLTVTVEHVDDVETGTFVQDALVSFAPYRFAHFSGSIRFGDVASTVESLAANPVYQGDSQWTLQVGTVVTGDGLAAVHTADAPPPLTVQRSIRGDLTVLAGALEVPGPKAFSWSGWTGQRGLTLLGVDGLVAESITLDLPPGLGWRSSNERLLRSVFETSGNFVALDADLNPVGPAHGVTALPMQFFSETYPVEFASTAWTWSEGVLRLSQPSTRFVRQMHYQDWQTAPGQGDIPESNDGFWFLLRPLAASDLAIRPGMQGGITVEVRFRSGEFFGHFPLAAVRAPAGGVMHILNNRVVPDQSGFADALAHVLYGKGCRDPGQPGALAGPGQGMEVAGVDLQFTPSAGLYAEGTLTTAAENPQVERHLEIGLINGAPTHRTDPFTTFRYYQPGAWIPHEDGFDLSGDGNATVDEPGEDPLAFNPARYLLSGVRSHQGFALEHPDTPDYLVGEADYAGANFRHFAGLRAESNVGGVEVAPYPLTARTKYYARRSGVSGIHESEAGPDLLPAYGYDINLARFGLSFLGNTPHDSRIDGAITLPHPTALVQEFERLLLSCCGQLTEGRVDPENNEKQLAYWSATRIVTRSLRFSHDPNSPCDTEEALLELGVTADVAHLAEEPAGYLYPRPDGTLVATDDLGRESHLVLPALVDLAGYPFSAVRRAYFNDYDQFTAGPGWLNVVGLAGVSFFRDLTVHGHILGSTASPLPPIFLKSGWASGGQTFFNQAAFDPGHRGYPPGATPADYQAGNTHLPRAEQVWFGGVPFDYPVRFDGLTRTFHSPQPAGVDLVVLESQSEVERLNAELADLRFSAFLDLSLLAAPEFLVEEGASWVTGHMEEAAVDKIREGLDRLSALLDVQMRQTLEEVLLPALEDGVVIPLVAQLPANGNPAAIDVVLDQVLDGPLIQGLQGLAEVGGSAASVTEQAGSALAAATETLENVRNVLLTLQQAEQLIVAGLEILGIDVEALPAELREEVLAELESDGGPGVGAVGRLIEIREAIAELEAGVAELLATLEAGQQFFAQLQDTVFTPLIEYGQLATQLKQRLGTWLKGSYALDPGAYAADELRARVRLEIRDAFAASPVAANLQAVFRSWVYNTDSAVRQALDTAFQAINDQIVELAMVALEEILDAVQPVKTFSSVVESVNWDGRAQIRGDRLSLLRLDNRAVINVPTPLPSVQIPVEFTGFYQFRELTSDGPVGCLAGVPGRANEILLGSSIGPASMFGAGATLNIESKFTRSEDGELLQLAGGLEMDQQGPDFQSVGLQEFSATLSAGPAASEFYLSAFCRGRFGMGEGSPELAGGVLLGRTCTLDPFAWDPLAQDLIEGFLGGPVDPGNPFTGAYLFGEATLPLVSVGCVYRGSVSAGVRGWANDPDYDFANIDVGGRLDGGVSGEFLCLAKVKGEAFLQGALAGGGYSYAGGTEVSGKLGWCPVCVEFGGSVQAHYEQGQGWSITR